ncbi:hypothetical protein ACEF14_00875 [Weissella paramesenteroides]
MKIKEGMKFKLNVSFGFINSIISAFQTFWFILYIKSHMGSEAYGYISVVNGIISTLLVISSAVASMGTRFILVNFGKQKIVEAKQYFNSELIAMICSGVIVTIFGIIFTLNLNNFMNVRPEFYHGVQILFLLTIFSFSVQLLCSPFSASFFQTNELYLTYFFFMLDYMARIITTIILFKTGHVVLWSAAIATDVIYLVMLIFYIYYSYRKMPALKINFSEFRIKKLFDLVKSGIWIAISTAGNMMLSSLNLYFSNILCGVLITGIYASIMQFNIISVMILTVLVNSLLPKMFKLFSSDKTNEIYYYSIYSMSITALALSIVSGGIIIFGNDFMGFWMGKEFKGYQLLIFLTVVHLPLTLPSQVLNQSFNVMNKVRVPAIATIIFGMLNLILAIVFSKFLSMGIYGIAFSSLFVQILRDVIFYPLYFSRVTSNYSLKLIVPFILGIMGLLITISVSKVVYILLYPSNLMIFMFDIAVVATIVISLFRLVIRKYQVKG